MTTPEELLKYAKGKIKTYTFHKLNLKDCNSKEKFDEAVKALLEDIFEDSSMLMEIEKQGNPVPKPVVQSFVSLGQYSDNVLNFFNQYKNLMNY